MFEVVLHQLESVSKGVVLCYKPGQPEQEILAFVVSKKSSSSIQKSLFEKLVSYAMPRVFKIFNNFMLQFDFPLSFDLLKWLWQTQM